MTEPLDVEVVEKAHEKEHWHNLCLLCSEEVAVLWPCPPVRLCRRVRELEEAALKAKALLDAPENCTEREVWRRNTAAWKLLFDVTRALAQPGQEGGKG